MKLTKPKMCICGHKEKDHAIEGGDCYVYKHIKGSHYQCTCRKFVQRFEENNDLSEANIDSQFEKLCGE